METTELRLTNYVRYKYRGVYGKVVLLQYDAESFKDNEVYIEVEDDETGWLNQYICRPNDIEPIPLTEDLLLKCGAKKYYIPSSTHFSFDVDSSLELECFAGKLQLVCNSMDVLNFDIKYLHQLQNLYFAITGKELEIKL